jgi:small subunit ribosomal protein S25e
VHRLIRQAPANTGAKKQKKKWSKGKVKDKAQHAVILDKATSDKLYKDVQSSRLITVAVLVDRLKINGSVARRCLKDLEEKGLIKKVVGHSKLSIYSMWHPNLTVKTSACARSTKSNYLQLVRSVRRNSAYYTNSTMS